MVKIRVFLERFDAEYALLGESAAEWKCVPNNTPLHTKFAPNMLLIIFVNYNAEQISGVRKLFVANILAWNVLSENRNSLLELY